MTLQAELPTVITKETYGNLLTLIRELGRKGSTYDEYSDGRIRLVSVNSKDRGNFHILKVWIYLPNDELFLVLDTENQFYMGYPPNIHLDGSYYGVREYHPGLWLKYLIEEVAPRGKRAQMLRLEQERKALEAKRRAAFAPVDDSNLFFDMESADE